ncbi:MAG: ROK family protein [Prevotella sp.]|nr:ROK family protein [Prevotella sp.]
MTVNTIKTRVIGVDIGIERTSMAIVDVRGNIIARDGFPMEGLDTVHDYVGVLSERVVMLAEANGGFEGIRSMGISAPSGNYLTGCIENPPNLNWKGQVPLAALLRDRLGLAVALANDAHVSALGEYVYGCAHGLKNFITMTLGHGIGSCIFSEGQPHLGADGFAGEVGHTAAVPGGRTCGCGKRGCLEAYCGAAGIVLTAKEMMSESNEPSLMRNAEKLTPKLITEYCEKGDKMAIEVYRRTGKVLGLSLAGYASILDPEAIIFTGGIALAGHWLIDPANETFEEHVFHNIRGRVRLLISSIDNNERDVLGASALAWGIKEYSLFK